jgi:antitoxin component YwqK of YwqJK toxin-antitoxin module
LSYRKKLAEIVLAAALALGIGGVANADYAYDDDKELAQKALKMSRENPAGWQRMEPGTGWKGFAIETPYGDSCIVGILNGKLDKEILCSDATGELTRITMYKNGLKHGWETKYVDGEVRHSINWKNGVKHGTEKLYDTDGSLFSEEEYNMGRLLRSKTNLGDGIVDHEDHEKGMTWMYYSNGQLKYLAGLHNGELHGNSSAWRKDGRLESTGSYAEGKKHGRWVVYLDDGRAIIENYNMGLIGSSAMYDKTGKVVTEFWR